MPEYVVVSIGIALIAAILAYFVSVGLGVIAGLLAIIVLILGLAGKFGRRGPV